MTTISDDSKGDISLSKDLVEWINDDSIDILARQNYSNSTDLAPEF